MFTSFKNIKVIKKTKQAFSLIEVLIAVMLLSVVIVALLQTNQNNLSFLNKFESSSAKNNHINLAFFGINTNIECSKDESFHLDDIADFKDDEIRKQLKEVKITSKCEKLKEQKIEAQNHQFLILATKQNLQIENTSENVIGNTQDKNFYRFSLEYK